MRSSVASREKDKLMSRQEEQRQIAKAKAEGRHTVCPPGYAWGHKPLGFNPLGEDEYGLGDEVRLPYRKKNRRKRNGRI